MKRITHYSCFGFNFFFTYLVLKICPFLINRSLSPKSKDSKLKREKNIKVEDDEDEKKKKEKVQVR